MVGEVLNVATGADISVERIADLVLEQLGKPAALEEHVPERPGQVDRHIGSTEKAERVLGWRARTSFGPASSALLRLKYEQNRLWWEQALRAEQTASGSASLICWALTRPSSGCIGPPGARALRRLVRSRSACSRFQHADRRAVVSVEDEAAVSQLARAEEVDGIIAPGSTGPWRSRPASPPAGAPATLAPETATLTVLKHRQRKCLAEHRVPQPRWEVATAADDGLPLPAVVKPVDRQGQKGLAVVEDEADYRPRDRRGRRVAERPGARRGARAARSPYFSVGGVFHPLTVTDKPHRGRRGAFGVALAHVWPSAHPVDGAVEAARLAADALGVTHGPTYTQIVLGPEGPRVMELAARLGGGHDAELCRVALGVDLSDLALAAAALGEPLEVPAPRPSGGAVVPLPRPSRGRAPRRRWARRGWPSRASWTPASTRPAGSSAPSGAETTGPATSSPGAARAATTRSRAPTAPPSSSDSGPSMQKLSSRRSTFLSFQPPAVGEEEIEAVAETLRSGWLTTGPRSEELERRFAEYVGAKHGVALAASGTAAMHLAAPRRGRRPGRRGDHDAVTWPATGNVIVHCGARPVFVDVRENDLNIDPEAVAAAVTGRRRSCPSTSPTSPPTSTRSSRWGPP